MVWSHPIIAKAPPCLSAARALPQANASGKMIEAAAKMGNLSAAEYWFRQAQPNNVENSFSDCIAACDVFHGFFGVD